MFKLLLLPVLLLLACLWNLDVVDTRHATRADLERDGGWLPPILPGSVHDIRAINNLDLNMSEGEFAFSDTDAGAFFARLSLEVPDKAPHQDWPGILAEYGDSGHVAWSYQEEGEIWVFFCHPTEDACDYLSWTSREWIRGRLASAKQAHAGHRPQ